MMRAGLLNLFDDDGHPVLPLPPRIQAVWCNLKVNRLK